MSRVSWFALLGVAISLAGCESDGPASSPWWSSSSAGSGAEPSAGAAGSAEPSPTPDGFLPSEPAVSPPLRRLTRAEYQNTVRNVLGVEPPDAHALPDDSLATGFRGTANQLVTIAAANRYLDAAIEVGERLEPTITQLMPCSATEVDGERACIESWLAAHGTQLFRRPLTPEEQERFGAAFERARQSYDYPVAAKLTVESLLVAPELLFVELPSGAAPGQRQPLDSWQVAARLSLLLWDSAPDEPLLQAAERAELTSAAAVEQQIQRMLSDERARPPVRSFFDDWLGLAKIENVGSDSNAYPFVPRERAAAYAAETRAYVEDVFWQQDDFRGLFVSNVRFRDAQLSIVYDDGLSSEGELARFELAPTEQSFGLLSQAGFLMALTQASSTAAIHRGAFVRRKLLCGRLLPPPPGLATPLPAATPEVSTRQAISEHTAGAACIGCHGAFNSLGFALERFDVAGRYRDTDNGLAIDTHVVLDEPGLTAELDGAWQLSEALAQSTSAQACAVQQLFTFALERTPTSADQVLFDELLRKFVASGFSLKAALAELVLSEEFMTRVEPEAAP